MGTPTATAGDRLEAPDQPAAPPPPAAADWGPVTRLLFRFAFVYLIVYNLDFLLTAVPYGMVAARPYMEFWNAVVPLVGSEVFDVSITVRPNGSGDTTYNYVQ